MIFDLAIEQADGRRERIVSDPSWQMMIDRAHRPGQFKRWFLRSLQEEFDARLHPFGWDTAEFAPDATWMAAAMVLPLPGRQAAGVQLAYPGAIVRAGRPGKEFLADAARFRCCGKPKCRPRGWPMRAGSIGSAIRPTGSSSACRTVRASNGRRWPSRKARPPGNCRPSADPRRGCLPPSSSPSRSSAGPSSRSKPRQARSWS